MKNATDAVELEPGGKIEGADADEGGPVVMGKLRRGYSMQVGSGRSLRTVTGPARIALDEKTAKLHLHKFDNKLEIRKRFGWPIPSERVSLEESVRQRTEFLRGRTHGLGAAAPSGPPVDAMIRDSVKREVDGLRRELPGMIAGALVELGVGKAKRGRPPGSKTRRPAPAASGASE